MGAVVKLVVVVGFPILFKMFAKENKFQIFQLIHRQIFWRADSRVNLQSPEYSNCYYH